MHSKQGVVFWLTGLSGSGKTTIGQVLARDLRARGLPVVLLDGDILREIFGGRFGHDRADRLEAARQYSRLCRQLALQGVNVVCATISLFHDIHNWNRANIERYREVYLSVPMDELRRRDSKGLYAMAARAEIGNVVGIHIEAETPRHPDLVIESHGAVSPQAAAAMIVANWEASERDRQDEA